MCIYNALLGDTDIAAIIEPVEIENVFVVPATIQLAGAEIELVSAFSRETKLKSILDAVQGDFDFVIIDCPPSLGPADDQRPYGGGWACDSDPVRVLRAGRALEASRQCAAGQDAPESVRLRSSAL